MAAAIFKATCIGGVSYVFCRAMDQSNPFEKAVLATILIGIRELADTATANQFYVEKEKVIKPWGHVLIISTRLLSIPLTLYIGRMFNFKATDYLQLVGVSNIGYGIVAGSHSLIVALLGTFS